ncbi:hypothetical protein D3C74_301770 [compost metagenome]
MIRFFMGLQYLYAHECIRTKIKASSLVLLLKRLDIRLLLRFLHAPYILEGKVAIFMTEYDLQWLLTVPCLKHMEIRPQRFMTLCQYIQTLAENFNIKAAFLIKRRLLEVGA